MKYIMSETPKAALFTDEVETALAIKELADAVRPREWERVTAKHRDRLGWLLALIRVQAFDPGFMVAPGAGWQNLRQELAEQYAKLRSAAGTQYEVAALLGINRTTIAKREAEMATITPADFLELAHLVAVAAVNKHRQPTVV